ncbi:type 2 isopentenyl-diphosphate Delta-isomerase [Dethiobacter alkaliphilus]|uniref:Isopentenyl-diphosphate delta-isomerase n=1 Tax=Dethiobacter alkaliphilus AHT 1 TaxID=555088 RepID=C0GDU9_DETAL|nr:type 2 isopentenyl-diphosphate Delta-isomerase [Dethiobacter alkaliphilus]EEG78243.1 isopentenyl-diphosphate delta-isomerase, type 2 [Dethiobacter alkaliphilus AHT 1]
MSRQARKLEHLWHAVRSDLTSADFCDINLVHNCLPETSLKALDLSTNLAGINLRLPLFINAITGGVEDAECVNRELALTAKECGMALAVGSQMAALENPLYAKTFHVVREVYPDGIIFANIGAYSDVDMARRAVDMVRADALQIHLNVPQELMMKEGDTDFRGYRRQIEKIVGAVDVPVIIKEVGFGVAREQAAIFKELGVAAIDVGGKGGTNFMLIERRRAHAKTNPDLLKWGIPTAISILEAKAGAPDTDIVASGGLNSGLLAAKALALGANTVGIAGLAAKMLLAEGREKLVLCLNEMINEMKMIMVMTGAHNIAELREVPLVVTGETRQWLDQREISLSELFSSR